LILRKIKKENLKIEITTNILNNLPSWFGIPSAITEYAKESSKMPYWAVYENDNAVGFIALKQHNKYASEIYVMGIKEEHHRKGIGKVLIQVCCDFCKENDIEFLQVKTLDESNPDSSYAKTREFYMAMGFRPLECFTELWDESNPCLIMIMHIDK